MHPSYPAIHEHIIRKLRSGLSPDLSYHSIHHTLDVLQQAVRIAREEGRNTEQELMLLGIASLYHDSGFLFTYKDHEESGCVLAQDELPGFGLDDEEVSCICGLIMATKLPQSPLTKLEEIICDADLDYLGRDDFFPIADKLYREMKVAGLLQDKKQWNLIQLAFLQEHRYFTDSSIQLRNEKKLEHLEAIRKIVDDDGTLSS